MLSAQKPQPLPSLNLVLHSDHYKTILPNISYPSRSMAHVPWSGSSAPLVFKKTTRPEMEIAITSNVQVPTANLCFDICSVPKAFYGMSMLIWYNFSMIVRQLKLIIKSRLFGVRASSSETANV